MTHGTCGRCGGAVTTPDVWWSIVPPTPQCESCGAVPREAHGPVLNMKDGPRTFTSDRVHIDAKDWGYK